MPLYKETLPPCNTAKSCFRTIQGYSNIKCIYSTHNLQPTQPSRLPWCGWWNYRPVVMTFLIIEPPTCLLHILHLPHSEYAKPTCLPQGPHRYECVCVCVYKIIKTNGRQADRWIWQKPMELFLFYLMKTNLDLTHGRYVWSFSDQFCYMRQPAPPQGWESDTSCSLSCRCRHGFYSIYTWSLQTITAPISSLNDKCSSPTQTFLQNQASHL